MSERDKSSKFNERNFSKKKSLKNFLSLKFKLYLCNTEREMKATFVWLVFLSFDILKQ